jgi:hypothetical protein
MRGGWIVAWVIVAGCGGSDPVSCPHEAPIDDCDVYACHRALACDIFCEGGFDCPRVDCTDAQQCRISCVGSTCDEIDCRGAGNCYADCASATTCAQQCDGADICTMKCTGGAACLIECGSSPDCSYVDCDGEILECPDNVLACNRPCP